MKIAYLFPGQGSQFIGMGKDLYDEFSEVRSIYDRVETLTEIPIKKLSFEENDLINQTKYTQLAVLTHSLGILEVLKNEGIKPYISAGLSLGEYTALIDSGILDFDEGVKLVQKRGEFMEEGSKGSYKMAAILGLDDKDIEDVCNSFDKVFIANYNSYEQTVISGVESDVDKAIELLKEKGAKVMPINTSGPFHTKFLEKSSELLKEELEKIDFHKADSLVVKNLDGTVYSDDDNYIDILSAHIINPVRFTKVIETMLNEGVDIFVEIGPGKTLSGLLRKINRRHNKDIKIYNISDKDSLINTLEILKGEK